MDTGMDMQWGQGAWARVFDGKRLSQEPRWDDDLIFLNRTGEETGGCLVGNLDGKRPSQEPQLGTKKLQLDGKRLSQEPQ